MALAIDSGMQVPYLISINGTEEDLSALGHAALVADVEGFEDFHFRWKSAASAWQVQWRTRKRLNPNSLLPTTDYSVLTLEGTDWWTEWTDWQGADITGETVTPCTKATIAGTPGGYTDDAVTIPYDFTQYDLWQFAVRVRAVDTNARKCSNWGESDVLSAGFCPRFLDMSAEPIPGEGWRVSVDTNWHRGGNELNVYSYEWQDGQRLQSVRRGAARPFVGLGADFELTLPCAPSASADDVAMTIMDLSTQDCSTAATSYPAEFSLALWACR